MNNNKKKVLDLLHTLKYHHSQVKKPDEFGVRLYSDCIDYFNQHQQIPSGKLGYILQRIHPNGRWNTYYSKVHCEGHGTKKPHQLVEYFRCNTDELILSGDCHGFSIKDEVKIQIGGSEESFDQMVSDFIYQRQLEILGKLINKLTSEKSLRELPRDVRLVLTKGIGYYFMSLGNPLVDSDLDLLRSLLIENRAVDPFNLF